MHNTRHTEESKKKMSIANKGKHLSSKTEFKKGGTAWNKGLNGYKLSESHRVNIANALKGNKYNVGVKRSDEAMKRIKEARKGMIVWNKGTVGVCKPSKTSFKRGQMSGVNNINWKGGVSSENEKIRRSLEYKLWQDAVKNRDGNCCVRCGEKELRN